jgi:hypothetical protein
MEPGCHSAERPSENDCAYPAGGEASCQFMVPVTMKKELNMRSIQWLGFSLMAVLLLLCGCGGGSSPSPSPVLQAPSGLSYTTATAVYIKGTAITPNSPTSAGGAVTLYGVSPALPAGLSLSTTTGVISGTPTAVTATASYTVTASNAAGSTTATLTITVEDAAPAGLAYTTGTAVYTVGTPIPPNSPTSTGGAVTSYSVNPALPGGLTLSTSTGVISGTPTAVTGTASYAVTASNTTGSTTATLTITVNPAPLSADNINLIFVVSEDLAYQASGDVNPLTANLTSQGLQRSLLMAPFLQQNVLGGENVTGIYALEPMTHLQTTTTGYYPDMVALETIQQFALLNHITLSSDAVGGTFYTGNNYPINASYALGSVPIGVATPSLPCPECQGLDFDDQNGDNETLVTGIVTANVPGFYVFSAPWETTSNLLANINELESYNLTLPASHQGPNNIYAISIAPSGSADLVTFNSSLNPPSTYPVLPPPALVSTPCMPPTPSSITVTGGIGGAVIPAGANTNETLYIVRHAEAHPQGYWSDNNYVGAGQWRALDLPNALRGKISPNQVWSGDVSQFSQGTVTTSGDNQWSGVAPALTVEPYAIANNLPYNLVTGFELSDPNAAQLTSNFFFIGGLFSNQKVLLGWSYVQIAQTVTALFSSYFPHGGGPTAPAWSPTDYDTVWTVTLDANSNLTVDYSQCEGINSATLPATAPQF